MIQNIATSATMAVSFAILARLITTKEMGILTVLLLVNGLFQTIGNLALPQAATKFIAEHSGFERRLAASAFYQVIRTTLLLATPLALAVMLGAGSLATRLLGGEFYTIMFQVLAFDIIFYAGALPALSGAMLGLRKFREIAFIGILNTLLRQTLIIMLIILLQNFLGLVVAWVIADVAVALIYASYVSTALGRPRFDFPLGKLLRFSWPLFISSILGFAYAWFDRALLLFFVPLGIVGVYNTALTAFSVLASVPDAMAIALFPTYAAMRVPHQGRNLSNTVCLASRYVSLIGVPLALGLFATAKPALALFLGQAYVEGAFPVMILAGIFAFTMIETVLAPILLALGETHLTLAIKSVSVAVSFLAAVLLLPILGMVGASIARGFAMIGGAVLTIILVRRKINLRLDLEAIAKALMAGTVMVAIVIAMQILSYSRFLLPVYAITGFLTYVIMLRLLKAVRNEDIELIRNYLGGKLTFATNFLSKILLCGWS